MKNTIPLTALEKNHLLMLRLLACVDFESIATGNAVPSTKCEGVDAEMREAQAKISDPEKRTLAANWKGF